MNMRRGLCTATIVLSLFGAGCGDEDPPSVPGLAAPGDFVGTWVFRPSLGVSDPSEIIVTFNRSKAGVPAEAGGVYLEGRFGPNEIIRGTAKGSVFTGLLFASRGTVVGNSTGDISMQILGDTNSAGLAVIDDMMYYDVKKKD